MRASSQSSAAGRVEIGIVGRPHGVRGALHVFLHNPSSSLIEELERVLIVAGDAGEAPFRIAGVRRAAKSCIVELESVDSRERAEELRGARVCVPRDALPTPAEGEFYVHDLIGLEVRVGGARIGAVAGSRAQGGVEILTVRCDEEDLEVPLVADYVVAIDLAAGRIEIAGADDLPRTRRAPRRDDSV